MSAHTERLLTEIADVEAALAEAKAQGLKPAAITTIEANLAKLRGQLTQANEALNEGKQTLLKG